MNVAKKHFLKVADFRRFQIYIGVQLFLALKINVSLIKSEAQKTFFSIWIFFHEHSRFTGQQGKGEVISLTPLYHLHSFHRHLDINLVIIADYRRELTSAHREQLGSDRESLVSERMSLTTKPRALKTLKTLPQKFPVIVRIFRNSH